MLLNLDCYVGAENSGILVGKVTPKGESKRLLRVFGEKAADVKDTSLRVPPGVKGTIVEIRVFSRRGIEKDERAISIENNQIEVVARDRDDELKILEKSFGNHLRELLNNQTYLSGTDTLTKNTTIKYEQIEKFSLSELLKINISDEKKSNQIESLVKNYENQLDINKNLKIKLIKFKVETTIAWCT